MSLDASIISWACTNKDALTQLQETGMDASYFADDYQRVWTYVCRVKKRHGTAPSRQIVKQRYDWIELPNIRERDLPILLDDLKKRKRYNQFITALDRAATNASDPEDTVEIIQELQSELNHLVLDKEGGALVDLFSSPANKRMVKELQKRRQGKTIGLNTGLKRLDFVTGGLAPSRMTTIIGRTGRGKSWVNLLFVASALLQGGKVILYPLEMTLEETAFRLYTILSQRMFGGNKVLKNMDLAQGKVTGRSLVRFLNILEDKFEGQLMVADMSRTSMAYTVEKIGAEVELHKPDFWWVDYITLMDTGRGRIDDHVAVRYLSSGIKQICVQTNTAGGCSAQVNRESLRNNVFLPRLEHISFGDCLSGSTIIETETGLSRIEDLVGETRMVWDGRDYEPGTIHRSGKKTEWIVTLDDGTELRASGDHKIWVQDGDVIHHWKKVRDIEVGDYALIGGMFDGGCDDVSYLSPLKTEGKRPLLKTRQPSKMTEDLAEVMGLLVGDGALKQSQSWTLAIYRPDSDLAKRVSSLICKLFGYDSHFYAHATERCDYVAIHSRGLIDTFVQLGMQKEYSRGRYVPHSILGGPNQIRAAFLRGLMEADGSFNNIALDFATSSNQLAQEAQIVLRSLGIDSHNNTKERRFGTPQEDGYKRQDMYRVRIHRLHWPAYEDVVGFVSQRKKKLLADQTPPKTRLATRAKDLRCLTPIMIASVEKTDHKVEMYDVCKRGTNSHAFTANGIVVHNSIGADSDCVVSINKKGDFLYYCLSKNRHGPEFGKTRVKFAVNEGVIEDDTVQDEDDDDYSFE